MREYKIVDCMACCGKGKVKRFLLQKITEKQKKDILILYRKGLGIREIQRAVGLKHPYTVSYWIKTCNRVK